MSKASREKSAGGEALRPLVLGLGTTGLSVARHFRRSGTRARYADSRAAPPGLDTLKTIDAEAEVVLGPLSIELLHNAGPLVVSPGIADTDPFLAAAREAGAEIVTDIDLFVAAAKAPFVAITGSNGKSTVTTLVSLMCQAAGRKGPAGGNLGVAALDLLDDASPDYYVLELSSFQLQRTRSLPASVAVLLNISADHLDWHRSEAEYRDAKYRIFAEAKAAVVNRDDPDVADRLPDSIPVLSFGLDAPDDGHYGLREAHGATFLARGEELLLDVADLALVGVHNQANALAALATGELMGLDTAPMLQVLHEFPGLPHRMQRVADIGGATWINDSKATNVGAAIASVNSVRGLVVLIAGGQGKGGDFAKLASETAHRLRALLLIGEDAPKIEAAFAGKVATEHCGNLAAAVNRAAEIAEPGDTVLLAPACASFDQYPNYQARGDDFHRRVEALLQ